MPWILPPLPGGSGGGPGPTGGSGSGGVPSQPLTPAVGTDPYGIDLSIDSTGDVRVTHSGSIGLVAGAYNMAQAVTLRLRTVEGDLALHPEYGSRLAGQLIGAKLAVTGLARELNSELQIMVSEDARFTAAQIIEAQHPVNGQPDAVQLAVRARLVGGEQLTLENLTDPAPSDVSLPTFVDPTVDPTLAYDPTLELEFFADQSEFDGLQDLNQLQALVNDLPPGG